MQQNRIMFYMLFICPMVNRVISTKNNGKQNDPAYDSEHRYASGDSFCYSPETYLPTAPCQRSGTNKKHGRVDHQQEINTVLQQAGPKARTLVFISAMRYV